MNVHFYLSENKTVTLPHPQVLKPVKTDATNTTNRDGITSNTHEGLNAPVETNKNPVAKSKVTNVQVQTIPYKPPIKQVSVQTVEDEVVTGLKQNIHSLNKTIEKQRKELAEALTLVQQRTRENLVWNSEKVNLEAIIQTLKCNSNNKEKLNEKLQEVINELRIEMDNIKALQITEINKKKDVINNENKSLLLALKQLENDKNVISTEYKELLNSEREEYSRTIKDLNVKNMELQSKLDR